MSISLRIRILVILGLPNTNTLKKLEYEYIFFQNWRNLWIQFGQNPYESIYGLESEYISFFGTEYQYNYPVRDMDLGP